MTRSNKKLEMDYFLTGHSNVLKSPLFSQQPYADDPPP